MQIEIIKFPKSNEEKLMMDAGLYEMDDKDYFRAVGASNSTLNHLDKSPAHLKWAKEHPKKTKAMNFGSALHMYLLQPDLFNSQFCIMPDFGNLKSSINRENKSLWEKENIDKGIISSEEMEKLFSIEKEIDKTINAKSFLEMAREDGLFEIAGFCKDPDTGIIRKMKMDVLCPNFNCIIDLKSTKDASEEEFSKSYYNYRYYRQAAYYLDNLNEIHPFLGINRYIIIAIENEGPFGIACYELKEKDLSIGREEYKKHLETYQRCLRSNNWPGYEDIVAPLSLPAWVYSRRKNNE